MTDLEGFGLTGYESRAYVALLSGGASDARALSTRSGLPSGRIYDVLNSLGARGLVERQGSRPSRFIAVEPGLALKRLLELKENEVASLVERVGKAEEELNRMCAKAAPKESLFWSVAVGDGKTRAHMERLAEAKKELLAYAELREGGIREAEIEGFLSAISGLAAKGVAVRLLVGYGDPRSLRKALPVAKQFLVKLDGVQVRLVPTLSAPFDVIDGEKVQLKVRNPAKPDEYFASIYIWQKAFAEELTRKFNGMWKDAREFRACEGRF